jgi:hypothetical protein
MKHPRAITTALLIAALSAACAHAQAAVPFPVVNTTPPPAPSHALANTAIAVGVCLIGSSFVLEHQADQAYDAYLVAIDPDEITTLYDRTVTYDRLSAAALIGGNVLVASGLVMRFVHRSPPEHLRLSLGLNRCDVSYRF